MSHDLSPKMRDYLAEVYRLSDRERSDGTPGDYVSTSELADVLDVSAPAVNRMVTKLRDLGLLEHEPYQGINLTDAGRKEALIALRRHRIAEAFLVKVMDFSWHEVHHEAALMASALSDALTDRMQVMAGDPHYCPHGEPIPTKTGDVEHLDDHLLSKAPESVPLQVSRVLTREPERLEYIAALQLTPGADLTVIHIAPFNGPMQLKVGEEYRIIGHNLAELIRVKTI
ncbi:MAG: metal-dependent transcriptional regulator [Aggregatilineales bacterium]